MHKNFRKNGPDLHSSLGWIKRKISISFRKLAQRNREDGNSAFQSGNHEMAILLYTEAMKYSPLNLAMGEGENMAVSAANRFAKSWYFSHFIFMF